ncbi:helix-turn-helix transcriptional regulator, partial [Saprospiraceae bacterium]|nr:helix-turn-helix transcriptional regulator [Saprospiraceae bacterium]
LNLLVLEYSSKQIADELFLGFETIRSHRKSIMSKVDVKSRAGMVRVALECSIIDLKEYYRQKEGIQHLQLVKS